MSAGRLEGFSLVELMIALGLGLFLIALVINTTTTVFRSGRNIEQAGEVAETSSYLSDLLTTELRLAGYFGQIGSLADNSATMPDICSGPSHADMANAMVFPLQGLNNVSAGQRLCGGDLLMAGSDVLLIRRVDSNSQPPGRPLVDTQHYIQATPSQLVMALGADSASFNLVQADGVSPAPIRAWHQTVYYLSADHTFKRRRFYRGSLGPSEPLAESVDDFQLLYGIDRSGDGMANAQNQQPAFINKPTSAEEWRQLVAVRFYLLVSSTESLAGTTEAQHYSYGDRADLVFNDRKIRRLSRGYAVLENSRSKTPGQTEGR